MDLTPDYSRVASPVSSVEELLQSLQQVAQFYGGELRIVKGGDNWVGFRWRVDGWRPGDQLQSRGGARELDQSWDDFSHVAEGLGWVLEDLSGDYHKGYFSAIPNLDSLDEVKNLQPLRMG